MHVDVLPRTHVPQWTIPNRVYHVVEDHTIPLTTAASVSSPDLNAVITVQVNVKIGAVESRHPYFFPNR